MTSAAAPSPRKRISPVVVVIGVVIALGTLTYFANPLGTAGRSLTGRILGISTFRNPSASMEPTLHRGSAFLVSSWAYVRTAPQAGDVIVYRHPRDPSLYYVKRIIAVGGSTLEIKGDMTYVDGKALAEPYVLREDRPPPEYRPPSSMPAVRIPPDHYFMMGDNRNNSEDSRMSGPIPRSAVVGKVILDP
jgi:signal peptidase I